MPCPYCQTPCSTCNDTRYVRLNKTNSLLLCPDCRPDPDLFGDLVRGVVAGRADLDQLIAASLTTDWEIGRLDLILRLIMEAGVHEITRRPDIPARVAITEYIDVAHAFFDGAEPGLVNGVLDRIAREHRPGEMTAGGGSGT